MNTKVAKDYVTSFERRYGVAHLSLACHAAFPLALTPDLLYRIWANFQRDTDDHFLQIPWIAVSEILLSNLCQEVGYDLYEMPKPIRDELLQRLQESDRFGPQRIQQLADFLLDYVRHQLYSDHPDQADFVQAQQWAGLAYTQPTESAHQISQVFHRLMQSGPSVDYPHNEIIRIAALVDALSVPLVDADLETLVIYARGMESFALGDLGTSAAYLSQLSEDGQIWIAGMEVPIPEVIRDNLEELQFPLGPDYRNQDLSGRSFKDQDLTRANFSGADIRGTDFTGATLIRANFSQARCGVRSPWLSLWILGGGLLALLSGMVGVASGWLLGLQLTSGTLPFTLSGIGSLVILGIGAVLVSRVSRLQIDAHWVAVGVSVGSMLTLSVLLVSTAYLLRNKGGFPLIIFSLVMLALIVLDGVLMIRAKRQALPMTVWLIGAASLSGIGGAVWLGFTLSLSFYTVVILAGLAVIWLSSGLFSLSLATVNSWRFTLASLGVMAGGLSIVIFGQVPVDNLASTGWPIALLATVLIGLLGFSALTCFMLAASILWLDTETPWMAQAWTAVAAALGGLLLLPIYMLGEINLYPPFKLSEDLFGILPLFTAVSGLGLYLSRRILRSPDTSFKKAVLSLLATSGTRFWAADLSSADFSEAHMKAADLRRANLSGTRFHNTTQLSLVCADRQFADHLRARSLLDNAQTHPPIFDGLDLQGINLSRTNLANASFAGSNLTAANLKGADLTGAKLINTGLTDANLSGAKLTGAYIIDWQITPETKLTGVWCDYIFTHIPTAEDPERGRYPVDPRQVFSPGEFALFIQQNKQAATKA